MAVRSVKARYEHGVLRPLEPVDLAEGATVSITIAPSEWEAQWRTLIERLRERTVSLPSEEIEAEITKASEEARAGRTGPR